MTYHLRFRFIVTLLALLLINATSGRAFSQGYTFSTGINTYADLSGATALSSPGWLSSDQYSKINLGFAFNFWGVNYTGITVLADGRASFSGFSSGESVMMITGDLKEHQSLPSHISYVVDGTAPNRIFKLQWKNAGFSADATGSAYINFQLWLFEGTDVLEIRHGGNAGVTPDLYAMPGGPFYSLTNTAADSMYNLKGNTGSPSFILNPASPQTLNAYPASSTTYRFVPVKPAPAKSITLNTPNGGEKWKAGESRQIAWSASGLTAIDIEYSTGAGWINIASGVNAAAGTYSWTIPNSPSASVKIKVKETGGFVQDESDAVFEIGSVTSVQEQPLWETFLYPNPSAGHVSLSVPSDMHGSFLVFDQTGRMVSRKEFNGTFPIALDELSPGLYTVQLRDYRNGGTKTMKLVIYSN